jgi:hypothetical protein
MISWIRGNNVYIRIPKNGISTFSKFLNNHGYEEVNLFDIDVDFKKLNPNLIIHGYDHSISRKVFKKNIRLILLNMVLLRFSFKKLIDSINLLFSYLLGLS